MGDLFQELKRRNIFKVGTAYLVLAWLILQVGSVLAPIMNLPEVVLSIVVFFLILGFPLALLFAWAFELTPEGLKRSKEVERTQSVTDATGKKLNVFTSALLVAVIALFVVDRFALSDGAGQRGSSGSVALGERVYDSIAVLPFVNMSEDKAQEYFSDGISEELLNLLAKTKGLRVAARTSSFGYKGQNPNIKKIGQELDVQTVLEGSVRKADTTLRVTAQLIDVDTGYHLWSETYDRELKDIFRIQDEISAAIVAALQVHFGGEAVAAPQQSYQPNLVAYEHYLQGQEFIKKRTKVDIEAALEQFSKAIEADAKFAPAYSGKADAYMLLSDTSGAYGDIPVKYAIEFARPLVELALELDPGLPEAHNSNGFLLHREERNEEALVAFDKAIELSPSFALAHMWRSQLIDDMKGELVGASALEAAYKLDPMSPLLIQNLANRLINLREFDRASYLVQKLEEVAPEKTSRIAFTRARLTYANGDTAGAYRLLKDGYENTSVVRNNLATLARFLNNEVEHAQYANSFWTVWFELGRERYDAADVAFANLSQDMREGEAGAYLRYMLHLRRREYSKAYEVLKEEEWDLSEAGDFFQVDVNSLGTPELSLMFRELGNREEAERLLTYTERRIAEARRDGYEFLTHEIDAQVAILRGDKQRAVAQLRQAKSLRYLNWTDKNSLVIRDLKGMLEFEALFDEVVDEVNAVRVELGWEALDREAFYPGKESG